MRQLLIYVFAGFSNLDLFSAGNSSAFKTSKDNLAINPLKMEIGLRAFVLIADTIQHQKDTNTAQPPQIPATFSATGSEPISLYLANMKHRTAAQPSSQQQQFDPTVNKQRIMLSDALARELGLGNYFEHIRRIFQDILKTLDASIGRMFLMTRPESTSNTSLEGFDGKPGQSASAMPLSLPSVDGQSGTVSIQEQSRLQVSFSGLAFIKYVLNP